MKLIWGRNKIFVQDEVPEDKINEAKAFLKKVFSGEKPFWYGLCKDYRKLYFKVECSDGIYRYQQMPLFVSEGFDFDSATYNNMKRNYNTLRRMLFILVEAKVILSFTLLNTGKLTINAVSDLF